MVDKNETHYVTRVVVERVDNFIPDNSSRYQDKHLGPRRDVTELANFLVKSDDLETLKSKMTSHVSLIEDFSGTDPSRRSR